MQVGAFLGYVTFGWIADRIGRRPAFVFYVVTAGHPHARLRCHAFGDGALPPRPVDRLLRQQASSASSARCSPELYPTAVRGAGQGFAYSLGRGLSALAPYAVGSLADHYGVGSALALNSGFFLLGAILIWTLPETGGVSLDDPQTVSAVPAQKLYADES